MGMYTSRRDLYSSKTASEVTSETYWIGDADTISFQVVGSPSTTTIQFSNDDGRESAITNWSTLTTTIGASTFSPTGTPGPRWVRALRSETTGLVVAQKVLR